MNTPDNDPFAYDDRLRALYEQAAQTPPAPSARVWQNLQPHLQLPPPAVTPASRRVPLLAGVGGLILGILLMWGVGMWGLGGAVPPAVSAVSQPAGEVPQPVGEVPRMGTEVPQPVGEVPQPVGEVPQPVGEVSQPVGEVFQPVGEVPQPVREVSQPVGEVPQPIREVNTGNGGGATAFTGAVPTILLPLVQTETAQAALAPDTSRTPREQRRAALRTQRTALAALTHRTDSLLVALGEPVPVGAAAVPDSVPPPAPLRHRWSVALAFAPERSFFGLQSPAGDSLSALRRTHEQGRGGYSATVLAEYRATDRLSIGAGVGMNSYGAELRLTDHRTTVTTKLDSLTTTRTEGGTRTYDTWNIRPVRDSVLSPIVDFNNQIIGYQYVGITRLDTVWTHVVTNDVTTHTTTTYTPTVTTRQELSARILKPNYRFLTVPLLLRYRLGRATDWDGRPNAPRWWADVAVGAQLQFFLGGTQAYTLDGLTYHTQRVGPGGGPFRPFNLALTGAVALNYALTPRLSASVAPTLRYQVESVYKASTHLTQRPTAAGVQLGLKLAF